MAATHMHQQRCHLDDMNEDISISRKPERAGEGEASVVVAAAAAVVAVIVEPLTEDRACFNASAGFRGAAVAP